jgi:hypothetical protein
LPHPHEKHIHESHNGLISAIGFGGFLIIVALVFLWTPNLWQNIINFAQDITVRTVPGTTNIVLPAPANPDVHQALYNALILFDAAIGALQVLLLLMRLAAHSTTHHVADKVADTVFWFGAAVLVQIFLLQGTLGSWFQYWTALIILFGITLIARAIVHFARR